MRLIVRHHHERYDGRGYPDGLAGMEIPLGARIVSVVDAFDVMRHGRPYAPARSFDEILEELRRERRRQFDPEMVDALMAVISSDGSEPEDPDHAEVETTGRAAATQRADVAVASWIRAEVRAPRPRAAAR